MDTGTWRRQGMSAQYVLGIDLGTTNCVLAYAPLDADAPDIRELAIPQLVDALTLERRTMLPAFTYLASDHDAAGGALDVPVVARPEVRGRRVCAAQGGRRAATHRGRRQVVAVLQPRRSAAADPAVECAERSAEDLARHGGAPLPGPSGRGLGGGASGSAGGGTARGVDGARVVRCRRAGIDARSGLGGRLAAGLHLARGTPGGRVCLAGCAGRTLAQAVAGGRSPARVRRRWRNHGLDADRSDAVGRRAAVAATGGRRSSAGGRRQHGLGARLSRGRTTGRRGTQARSLADRVAVACVPQRQGGDAGSGRTGDAHDLRARSRQQVDCAARSPWKSIVARSRNCWWTVSFPAAT